MTKIIKPLDICVAVLAAISCLLIFFKIPAWALFIGWAWYYTLGSEPKVFKQAIPPMIVGSLLAILGYILIDLLLLTMSEIPATVIAVFITVFLLMMFLKIPAVGNSLVAFNAYSCIFVGYAASTYLPVSGMPALLNAFIWITGANFIGLIFGWVSIILADQFKAKAA